MCDGLELVGAERNEATTGHTAVKDRNRKN